MNQPTDLRTTILLRRCGLTLMALAGLCILTACGTTSALKDTRGQVITSARKFSKVTVQDFKISAPEVGDKVNEAKSYFADRIATEIKKTSRFSSVVRNAKPDANTLVIDGVITKFQEGNAQMRFWIGMGAGSAFFEADVEFRDGNGLRVGKIKVDKNSWALGGAIAAGQSPKTFMDGAADKIAGEAAKLAK